MNFRQHLSKEIFEKKYMINGEKDSDEVFKGIAKKIAFVEKDKKYWTQKFYDEIKVGKFIPAGRILANARPNTKMPYFNNCYTIDIEDNMEGIYSSLQEDAKISATGGGVGLNFSKLRPKGASLSKGGESSGVISFMKIFNESAKIIQTGGSRRAAHIGILNVDHPEIEDFITVKQGDKNKALTQFNISVGITDAFIEAVKKDKDWDLKFEGKVYKTVKAKYLYDLMVKNAYEHNEPGILNIDNVHREANSHYMYKIEATNPCFTGDTIIAVADGRNGVSIKELAEENKKFQVYSGKLKRQGLKSNTSKWKAEIKESIAFKTGDKEVIEVFLSNGSSFKCTPDHLLARPDGSYIEASQSLGEELENFYTFSNKMTTKSYRHINSKTDGYARQYRMMWEYKNGKYDGTKYNVDHIDEDSTNDLYENLQLLTIEDHKQKLKESMNKDNPINRMKDTDRFHILQRQKNILANAKRYNWPKEKINEELESLPKLEPIIDTNCYLDDKVFVIKIEKIGIEPVYDLTVEDNHNFYIITKTDDDKFLNSSGVLVHNCGEITLPPYGVCDLGAVNLSKFVISPFTSEAEIDWEKLKNTIRIGVRFLDDALDVTFYPLDKIKKRSLSERRIGLGFTGYADMLAKLEIIYGSEESKEFTEKLGSFFRDAAYEQSIELAKEKGKFPKFDKKIVKSNFIQRMPKKLRKDILKYGLRNITLLTIAPTGTTALTVGQNCSSGIEPIFSLQYDRNTRTGKGDKTKKETVFDDAWLEYLDYKTKGKKLDESIEVRPPASFVTTFDIAPKDAIDIQAIWQKYIDASISKTLNLSEDITFNKYKDLFMYAYEKGLKGFTTFNPFHGSMKGILETKKVKIEKTEEGVIIRPKDVPCDIHEIKYKGKDYLLLVGILENSPYEVFVTKNEDKKVYPMQGKKKGIIRKIKKGRYDLIIENGEEKTYIENIIEKFDPFYLTLGRFISMGLRHNVPLQFIVEQLLKDKNFMGFERTVGRVLKKYIKDGEKVKTHSVCPECGDTDFRYESGCSVCNGCGFSVCG